MTLNAVASVGDLAPAAVRAATRYDDDRTANDRRRPRSPMYPGGDDTCKTRVESSSHSRFCYRPEDVIIRREMSYCLLL